MKREQLFDEFRQTANRDSYAKKKPEQHWPDDWWAGLSKCEQQKVLGYLKVWKERRGTDAELDVRAVFNTAQDHAENRWVHTSRFE